MTATLANRLIVVADIARSVDFYVKVFGFQPTWEFRGEGGVLDTVTQLKDVKVRVQMVQDAAGVVLEIVEFAAPRGSPPFEPPNISVFGLTHLAFQVPDIDAICTRIAAASGQLLPETRISIPPPADTFTALMMVSDPDGTRIELAQAPAKLSQFLWNGICVRDLDASIAFYKRLAFEPAEVWDMRPAPDWVARLNRVSKMSLVAQVIRNPQGHAIELIKLEEPQPKKSGEVPRAFNRFGLNSLAFHVTDRDATARRLSEAGGQMFDSTRIEVAANNREVKQYHGMDPDGVRIELIQGAN